MTRRNERIHSMDGTEKDRSTWLPIYAGLGVVALILAIWFVSIRLFSKPLTSGEGMQTLLKAPSVSTDHARGATFLKGVKTRLIIWDGIRTEWVMFDVGSAERGREIKSWLMDPKNTHPFIAEDEDSIARSVPQEQRPSWWPWKRDSDVDFIRIHQSTFGFDRKSGRMYLVRYFE